MCQTKYGLLASFFAQGFGYVRNSSGRGPITNLELNFQTMPTWRKVGMSICGRPELGAGSACVLMVGEDVFLDNLY